MINNKSFFAILTLLVTHQAHANIDLDVRVRNETYEAIWAVLEPEDHFCTVQSSDTINPQSTAHLHSNCKRAQISIYHARQGNHVRIYWGWVADSDTYVVSYDNTGTTTNLEVWKDGKKIG